ncbi:MAG: GGDEF domain-containing protein, partial [Sphingomonadales bacterium]|nr:GGDEF domain-containing protein [Sphingomonadales bacterium]
MEFRDSPLAQRSIAISDPSPPRNPLFLLSFRQRDELAAAVARGGWAPRLGHSFADGGGGRSAPIGPQWRWERQADRVEIDPELRGLLALSDAGALSGAVFFAAFGESGAADAGAAIDRLDESGAPTAFAHRLGEGEERLVHHISRDGEAVTGQVEQPDRLVEVKARGRRDPLTGLGDAHLARQWIEQRLAEPRNGGPRLVLLLIGLQRFDRINSTLGRAAGDAVLRGMARRIETLVGPMAGRKRLIARLAGAEFLIGLSPPTDVEEAELLARRLAKAIEQPFPVEDRPIAVKMRCGILVDRADDEGAPGILRRASAALAEARGDEGDAIRIFGSDAER